MHHLRPFRTHTHRPQAPTHGTAGHAHNRRAACCCSSSDGSSADSSSHPHEHTHYRTLDVPSTASQAEIKAAFRRLAQQLHPDKHAHRQQQQHEGRQHQRLPLHMPAPPQQQQQQQADSAQVAAAFLRCKLAYEVLSDAVRRREYDATLAAGGLRVGGAAAADACWMDAYSGDGDQQQQQQQQQDYYSSAMQPPVEPPAPAAAAAAATAASASSSGLSDYCAHVGSASAAAGGGQRPPAGASGARPDDPSVDDPFLTPRSSSSSGGGGGGGACAAASPPHQPQPQRGAPDLELQQFGSLQEALEALAAQEQRRALMHGLAGGGQQYTPELPTHEPLQ